MFENAFSISLSLQRIVLPFLMKVERTIVVKSLEECEQDKEEKIVSMKLLSNLLEPKETVVNITLPATPRAAAGYAQLVSCDMLSLVQLR